jgi:hypothetical protein
MEDLSLLGSDGVYPRSRTRRPTWFFAWRGDEAFLGPFVLSRVGACALVRWHGG